MSDMPTPAAPRLFLGRETARELMAPSPVSIRDNATVQEAVALLTDKGLSAVPVINEAGQPIGVLSQSDILAHDREQIRSLVPADPGRRDLSSATVGGSAASGADLTQVRDLMTPAVFSVTPDTSAGQVVEQMVGLKVHRLFVIDRSGVLIGVISALDILRHLRSQEA